MLRPQLVEFLLVELDVFALRVFLPFDNLVIGHFAMLGTDFRVTDPLAIGGKQEVKTHFRIFFNFRVDSLYVESHQPKPQFPSPTRTIFPFRHPNTFLALVFISSSWHGVKTAFISAARKMRAICDQNSLHQA